MGWMANNHPEGIPDDPDEFVYVQDKDMCAAEPAEELTFYYDRDAAIDYAVAHSYQNEAIIAYGWLADDEKGLFQRVTRPLQSTFDDWDWQNHNTYSYPASLADRIDTILYANFEYSDVEHGQQDATGSADFMSQSIWIGGLPMTMTAETIPSCGNNFGSVWRYCSSNGSGESTWDNHIGIVSYYTNNPLPAIPTETTSAQFNHVLDGQKGSAIPALDINVIAEPAIDATEIDRVLVELPIGKVIEEQELADTVQFYLSQSGSPNLVKGDYMWIGRTDGNRSHGLLIAGWGEVKDCAEVLNPPNSTEPWTRVGSDELYYSLPQGQPFVPYVVDFSGITQQPIPRPFYCTFYDASGWDFMNTREG